MQRKHFVLSLSVVFCLGTVPLVQSSSPPNGLTIWLFSCGLLGSDGFYFIIIKGSRCLVLNCHLPLVSRFLQLGFNELNPLPFDSVAARHYH